MANKTVADVYGYAQDLLRIEGDTVGIPGLEQDRTIEWVNDLHAEYFDEFRNAGRKLPVYMRRETGYTTKAPTTPTADVASGATTFTLSDSTVFDSSTGAGFFYESGLFDPFSFALNTAGVLTTVAGIDFAHESTALCQKMYQMPSDFGEFRPRSDGSSGPTLNGFPLFETDEQPTGRYFTRWQDSSGNLFLWMPYGTPSGNSLQLVYDKAPTTLTASGSTLDMPVPDHMYVVYGLLALFKQTLDESYVPTKERSQQISVLNRAMSRNTVGKRISASDAYFERSDDFANSPLPWSLVADA